MAIQVSVMAAFFDSLRRNAGTPLEIASTPVSATAPDENPRNRMNRLSVSADVLSTPASRLRPVERDRVDAAEPIRTHVRVKPEEHERDENDDVRVGGEREDAARLLDAAQVRERDDAG